MPISKLGFIASQVLKWIHLRLGLPCLRCQFQNLVSFFFHCFSLLLVLGCFFILCACSGLVGYCFQNLDAPKVRLGLNRPTIHLNSANFHVPQTGFSRILFLMDWILWHSDSPSGHKKYGLFKIVLSKVCSLELVSQWLVFGHTIECFKDFVVQVLVKKHISPGLVYFTFFP